MDARIEAVNSRAFPLVAIAGAFGGSLGGLLVGLLYKASDNAPRALILGGIVTGVIGGGLTVPTMALCWKWIDPFVSSTLLWCFVGFVAGWGAYRLSLWMSEPSAPAHDVERDTSPEPARKPASVLDWLTVRLLPALLLLGCVLSQLCVLLTTRY
jgi:hypothetical protein